MSMAPRLRPAARALLALGLAFAALAAAAESAARPCQGTVREAPPFSGFTRAASRIAPALVTILVLRPLRGDAEGDGVPYHPLSEGPARSERSFSSGFILDADGGVVSSAHSVEGATAVWVVLADGRTLPARVAGADRASDVAWLRIAAKGLPAVRTASRPVCAGDWVAAQGTPFGFEGTVTAGVVSAYPRWVADTGGLPLIQMDVALNPGSSGGPLFDAAGRVVGMNALVYSGSGLYVGVSFAVPIDRVLRLVQRWESAQGGGYPHLGLRTQALTPALAQAFGLEQPQGALVVRVQTGGPAQDAGLRPGDVILGVAGVRSGDPAALEDALAIVTPGGPVELDVWRDRSARRVRVRWVPAAPEPRQSSLAGPVGPEERLGLQFAPVGAAAGRPPGLYVEAALGSALLAGLEPGDRVEAVNALPVSTPDAFDRALESAEAAPVLALLVMRGEVPQYVAVRRIPR